MSDGDPLRFEARDVPSYAEPVNSADLEEGGIYFFVTFDDDELLIPTLEPIVFAGRDLEPGDEGQAYFQDVASYRAGVRYSSEPADDTPASFVFMPENELNDVFCYEKALDRLLACSLRRERNESR